MAFPTALKRLGEPKVLEGIARAQLPMGQVKKPLGSLCHEDFTIEML